MKKSQVHKLVTHLSKNKSITRKQAESRFRIKNFSARIYDLRSNLGLDVIKEKSKSGIFKYSLSQESIKHAKFMVSN